MLTTKQRLIRQLRFKKEMAKLKATWTKKKTWAVRFLPYEPRTVYYRVGGLRRIP